MKKILITGGAGFIGSNLALKLIRCGYQVRVLDNLLPQVHGVDPEKTSPLYKSIKGKVDFVYGSVNNRKDWIKAIKDIDCIVHLAAETGTGQSMYEIKNYVNTNIGGTALLMDILINTKQNVKKIIVAESRAIYGEGCYYDEDLNKYVYPDLRKIEDMDNGDFEIKDKKHSKALKPALTKENALIHPSSVYGITKQVQGQLIHLLCPAIGIKDISFRYQNVYGPGQSLSNPYTGILSIFSTQINNGDCLNIFEDGKMTRDFLYIDDAVDATILGIENDNATGYSFNIGSGIATDVLSVAKILMKKFGKEVPLKVTGNYRVGDIRNNIADISLAHKILGFTPKWDIENGIEKLVKWVKEQHVYTNKYEQSIEEMEHKGLYR